MAAGMGEGSADGDKWTNACSNTLESEMMGCVDGLDLGIKEKEESRMTPRFWLKQWVASDVIS
jgi:hypothetical protein